MANDEGIARHENKVIKGGNLVYLDFLACG
jgi:hypothetical protein